jgi:RNA polymerase sigma-70 factor (ECF subfamily)
MFAMTQHLELDSTMDIQKVSFHELVERHKKELYYLSLDLTGNHHDAEDLSQEVFIKAHKGLQTFRGDSSELTWLRRIAINTYLNQKRKKSLSMLRFFKDDSNADQSESGVTLASVESANPPADTAADQSILRNHIDRALGKLSPKEKAAFVLRHFHDHAVKEIADNMSVAEGTVKSLLFRATKKMQKELEGLKTEVLNHAG